MDKIYQNILIQVKEIIEDEKEKLKNKIMNSIGKNNLCIDVDEYNYNNKIIYSNGDKLFDINSNIIGFVIKDSFYFFE